LKPTDILFFVEIFVLIFIRFSKKINFQSGKVGFKMPAAVIAAAIVLSIVNLQLAEADRPDLLSRGFDRSYIVKYLGMYNYTIYDSVKTFEASSERASADSSDIAEIINFTNSFSAQLNEKYFGKAKDMNVIYLHLESMQSFLIDYELEGEQVTPFLNSLVKNENTMYFDNFYHQTAQGKTSDAEFMLENSLFGLPQGSAF